MDALDRITAAAREREQQVELAGPLGQVMGYLRGGNWVRSYTRAVNTWLQVDGRDVGSAKKRRDGGYDSYDRKDQKIGSHKDWDEAEKTLLERARGDGRQSARTRSRSGGRPGSQAVGGEQRTPVDKARGESKVSSGAEGRGPLEGGKSSTGANSKMQEELERRQRAYAQRVRKILAGR